MKLIAVILFATLALIVAKGRFLSFRAQAPADYENTGPQFSLKKHLTEKSCQRV